MPGISKRFITLDSCNLSLSQFILNVFTDTDFKKIARVPCSTLFKTVQHFAVKDGT